MRCVGGRISRPACAVEGATGDVALVLGRRGRREPRGETFVGLPEQAARLHAVQEGADAVPIASNDVRAERDEGIGRAAGVDRSTQPEALDGEAFIAMTHNRSSVSIAARERWSKWCSGVERQCCTCGEAARTMWTTPR